MNNLANWILLIVFCIAYLFVSPGNDAVVIWPCLIVFYYYFFLSVRRQIVLYRGIETSFKIDSFFMLFYYGLFYLPYQSHVLGFTDISKNAFLTVTFTEYTNVSIIASTIGLIAFIIGYSNGLRYKISNKAKQVRSNVVSKTFAIKTSLILLVVISVLFLLFMKTGYDILFGRSYATSDIGNSTSNGIYFLVSHFVTVGLAFGLVYFLFFKKINASLIAIAAISALWSIILIVTGDRNAFFIIAITVLAGFFTFYKSVGRVWIILFIFFGFTLYQIVETTRMSEKKSLDVILTAAFSSSAKGGGSIDESSFTITTTTSRAAFALVPSKYDFFLGKFKLVGFAGIIPYSRSLFIDPKDKFVTSSDVLVAGILGPNATWGVGTNVISDIYMDFGIIGVLVLMFALGWYGGYVTRKVKEVPSYLNIIIYIVVLALYAEAPRYSYDFPVRNIAWTLIFFRVLEFFDKQKFTSRIKQPGYRRAVS